MRSPPLILAVDDVPENLDIVRMRLEAHGYDVVTAADGEEAITQAQTHLPDLILLDIMMPKLDGISVLKILKQDQRFGFIPIILLTAKADRTDIVAGLDAGGDDYLTKPFDQAALIARVALDAADQGPARHHPGPGGAIGRADETARRLESIPRPEGRRTGLGNRKDEPAQAVFVAAGGRCDRRLRRTRRSAAQP